MLKWIANVKPGTVKLSRLYPLGLPKGHNQYDPATLLELGFVGLYTYTTGDTVKQEPEKDLIMKNTEEQIAFFREVEFGKGNIILESVAGSGKTTSIVQCLNYIDDEIPILACSFTKLAAQQLEKKIRANNFTNVNSTTLNSLGWGVCRSNVKGVQLDANKTVNILQFQLRYQYSLGSLDQSKIYKALSGPVKRLVGLLKSYVVRDNSIAEMERIADYHGVEIPEGSTPEATWAKDNFYKVVDSVYSESVGCLSYMDFDDQKFFPVYFGWAMPKYKYIIVDECQDCNQCDIEMIALLQKSQPDSRLIWVGDTMQAIYLFRGSLLNAMADIRGRFSCTYLTLSVCWRCADDILIEAREIQPLIRSPQPNPKGKGVVGNVETKEFLDKVCVGDYVICRTTAPLVKRCLQLVRLGKAAKVKGREVGRSLLNLIDKVSEMMRGFDPQSNVTLKEFITVLAEYKVQTVGNLEAANREEAAIRVQDEAEALTHFCMEASNVDDVARRIDQIFTDDEDDEKVILLLTGHKSKGLERDTVWFLRPDLCPFPKAKSEHEKEAEKRLRYVILTRAALNRFHVMPEPDEVKIKRER